MKILFTADWHIKLGQRKVPKDWQKARYYSLFEQIHQLEKEADILVIGGDIFDKLPTIEELELFFDFISGCTIKTFIYDGNHEATKRGATFLHNLKNIIKLINKNCIVVTEPTSFNQIDFIPYTHLKTFNPKDFNGKILCTHVRGSIPPYVIPEIDLNKLKRWKKVLAGDLHSYSNSQLNILYPGSPLTISFHRNKVKTGVLLFDLDTLEHKFIELDLPQLIRKRITNQEEAIKTSYDHTIYELETNLETSKNVLSDSELLDKKIVNVNTEATLNLANLSLEEEVAKYLTEVHNLSEDKIKEVLKELNDCIAEINLE